MRDRSTVIAYWDTSAIVSALGPWGRIHIEPSWERAERLARAWPLRGADLWHRTAAKELQDVLPELTFLSFDSRLTVAAAGEGLAAPR